MLLTAAQLFEANVFEVFSKLLSIFIKLNFQVLVVMCCILGLFDGVFITMIGPVAYDICGPKGAGQAIGFLLAMCSIPLTIGPPVAGYIYDKVGNYTAAFLMAGFPPLIGAGVMLVIRCYPTMDEGRYMLSIIAL